MTPYQVWHNQTPDMSHVQVWGCAAYMHVQKDKHTHTPRFTHEEVCINTQTDTKDGSFTFHPHIAPSYLKGLNLMRPFFQ